MRLKELYARRDAIIAEQRVIVDKASDEKRELTTDENATYNRMDEDFESLEENIEKEERLVAREKKLAGKSDEEQHRGGEQGREEGALTAMDGMRSWIRGGEQGMSADEVRALQADSDTQGGYLVTPLEMAQGIIQAIDDMTFMRGLSTVQMVVTAEGLGVPSLDNDPADPEWTAEIGAASEDSTMSFGNRELIPHKLTKLIKVSNKLLRLTSGGAETLVNERLGYKFGVTEENAFLNGSGAGQPLGVFTASNNGIPTGRDVSEDNSATAIKADGLINALYSLKGGYQSRAEWIFHRDAVKQVRKLKDGEGQYLWAPGLAGGEPSTILDRPFHMSEFAPNTFTSGLYVGIIGDFSNYWIAEAEMLELQRLVELYAANDQTGFLGRMWVDGMPTLGEAFARVTLG